MAAGGARRAVRVVREKAPHLNLSTKPSPVWLGFALIAVTTLALVLAGTADTPTGIAKDVTSRVALSSRALVCDGGIPGAQSQSGVARIDGVSEALPSTIQKLDTRRQINADKQHAAGVFASQLARSESWLALTACPEAHNTWWFAGVGGSEVHHTVLTIANPRAGDAVFDVSVFGPNGVVAAPGLTGLQLSSGQSRTLDLQTVAPAAGELAVSITASRGLVTVSAADTYAPDFVGTPVREWAAPQPAPATKIELTGLPVKPDLATLIVANTSADQAIAKLEVIGAAGTFEPKGQTAITVPPGTVATFPIAQGFDGKPIALRLTSEQPLVATVRSTVKGDISYASGATALSGASVAAIPADVTSEVRLSSLDTEGTATVTAYDGKGVRLAERTIDVPAQASVAAPLSNKARYVVVSTSDAGIIGSIVVANGKGIGTTLLSPAARALRLPQVRPGW